MNKGTSKVNKELKTSEGLVIMLINNEIKDITKVIRSIENRGILLKGITKKNITYEGWFLNLQWGWFLIS